MSRRWANSIPRTIRARAEETQFRCRGPPAALRQADVCIFSQSGLDTSMTYTVSGAGDIAVISKQQAGLGIIHLTLQILAPAAPGTCALFIQNTNLDKAGRRCKDALCARRILVSRLGLGLGPDLEGVVISFQFSRFGLLVSNCLLKIYRLVQMKEVCWFQSRLRNRTASSIVGSEPAAAEEKAGTERGKEDRPAVVTRLLQSTSQSFMQGRATRR
jgi:hypothetical protein